jgi:3-(3-hydroxy-phenyl)propionate hydroxylase
MQVIETPVLVVGAGPTGLLTANLLAAYGASCIVIDKAKSSFSLPRAILLDDEGFRSLQAVGLDGRMAERVLWNYGARYYSDSGACFARIEPSISEFGFPKRNSFHQPELEALLREKAAASPLIEIHFGTELTNLEPDAGGVTATLKNAERGSFLCRAAVLLACDGARSTVRERLEVPLEGNTFAEDWVVVDTANDPDRDHFSKFFCHVERPVVSIPAPAGGRRYEYMVMPGDNPAEVASPDNVRRVLSRFRRELGENDIVRAAIYTFHARIAQSLVRGRVALLGDAAHLSPPFAGQGMNAGLRDAHNMAWKAALVASGKADVSLLESYERERREPVRRMIDFAVTLGSIVMPKTSTQAEVIETLLRIASLFPEAEDYILNMRFKPKPHFEEGLFIPRPGDVTGAFAAPGRMLVQPELAAAGGVRIRLDDAIGPGFGLIAIGTAAGRGLRSWNSRLWANLGTTRIAIDPAVPPSEAEEIYFIASDACDLSSLEGRIIVVRPDRYVAAICRPEEEDRIVRALAQLLSLKQDMTRSSVAA